MRLINNDPIIQSRYKPSNKRYFWTKKFSGWVVSHLFVAAKTAPRNVLKLFSIKTWPVDVCRAQFVIASGVLNAFLALNNEFCVLTLSKM